MAWLSAVPESKGKGKAKDLRTRGQQFQADEEAGVSRPELVLPEIEPELDFLIGHLMAVGPSSAGEVLTFQEIKAWSELTGNVLSSWEASTLRELSRAYVVEHHEASAPDRPVPGAEKGAKPRPSRSEVSQRISDAFARLEEQDRKKGLGPA